MAGPRRARSTAAGSDRATSPFAENFSKDRPLVFVPVNKDMSAPLPLGPGDLPLRGAGFSRSAPRVELKSGATIKTAKHEFACELCDLSERGARIRIGGRAVPEQFELV